jgi:hypothetical protein
MAEMQKPHQRPHLRLLPRLMTLRLMTLPPMTLQLQVLTLRLLVMKAGMATIQRIHRLLATMLPPTRRLMTVTVMEAIGRDS